MSTFSIYFWTLSKRENSTLVPTTGRTEFKCRLLDGSGIMNPTIELNIGLAQDPSKFNYCHIPVYERYYHVTEWYFNDGLWTASLNVDVLATYKEQIGNSTLYVLRAANAFDGRIVDTMYPLKTGSTYSHPIQLSPFSSSGTYVLGVTSTHGDYGSLTYSAVNAAGLSAICNYLINSAVSESNGFNLSDASLKLQTSLIDPLQYIKTCMYYPFPMQDFDLQTATTSFNIFLWDIPQVLSARISGTRIRKQFTVDIHKHPQTNTRGNYVNTAPYTVLTLFAPPFGVIDIDTTVTCNASTIDFTLSVDPISGKGILFVECNGVTLNRLEAQIGVPIQLSQVTKDWLGAASSTLSAVGNIVGSAMTGNVGGLISGVATGIDSASRALTPRQQTMGTGGGFIDVYPYSYKLDHQFFEPVADDIQHHGRPLCQLRQLSSLGGYMLIQDGDVPIPGTAEEAQRIRSYLESGFYYE